MSVDLDKYVSGLRHDLWKHLITDNLDSLYASINVLYDKGYRLSGAISRDDDGEHGPVYTATLILPERRRTNEKDTTDSSGDHNRTAGGCGRRHGIAG